MAQKYIIHEGKFIKGNVKYHFELVPDYNKARPEGGGFWHIDPEEKKFYLYGISSDFGGLTRERVQEIVSSTHFEDRLNGFEVYHSYLLKIDSLNMREEDWTLIGVINNQDSRVKSLEETDKFVKQMSDTSIHDFNASTMLPDKKPFGKPAAVRTEPKVQRNELCPCGSGKKYKKCCI